MDQHITLRYYKKRIKDFNNTIDNFCKQEGIAPSFCNALNYQSNMCVGKFWRHLYAAPKIYLANSRTFLNYRRTLDPDFQDDILNTDEIFKFQQDTVKNSSLKEELKKIMQHDFIDYK